MILLRSMMFVPGHRRNFLEKSIHAGADALIFDLEDSVPNGSKGKARDEINSILQKNSIKSKVFIRVNELDSEHLKEDLKTIDAKHVFGWVVPKINSAADIQKYEALLSESYETKELSLKLCPLLETCKAFMNIREITQSSKNIVAQSFGGEDFITDLRGSHGQDQETFLFPRATLAIHARAMNQNSIDSPYLNIGDIKGFQSVLQISKRLGFTGAYVIHPSQVETANQIFSPSRSEVDHAQRVVEAIMEGHRKGLAVGLLDGELIGPPMAKRSYAILEVWNEIERNS